MYKGVNITDADKSRQHKKGLPSSPFTYLIHWLTIEPKVFVPTVLLLYRLMTLKPF